MGVQAPYFALVFEIRSFFSLPLAPVYSGAGCTVMVASSRFTGPSSPPPSAVFFAVPGRVGVATTSTVAEPPCGRLPKSHSTPLVLWSPLPQDPWLGFAETSCMLSGKKSLRPAC